MSICGECTSLLYFVVRVRCRRYESSRSLSHLLVSVSLSQVSIGTFIFASRPPDICREYSSCVSIGVDLAGILGDAWRGPQVDWCELGRVWGAVSPLQLTRGSGGVSRTPPAGPRPKTDFGVF